MPRIDSAQRVIAAPLEQVFAAFVDPVELMAWLPPSGMRGQIERFDARPGGPYRMVLTYLDGSDAPGKSSAETDIVEGRFLEIVPGVRVVQAVDFVSDAPAFAGTMTMTWAVAASNDGALVTFTAEDVPEGISADAHIEGMTSSLLNLAAHLER
jgi:uncharacterized protein YndB with AHSA1/START domain